jgi:four helix bundle protein
MEVINNHRDLIVWHKSIALASEVYAATKSLPSEERFGLQQQLRRAAVSVASHIAEGSARRNRLEFLHHLQQARGSLSEIETQTMIAIQQGYFETRPSLPADISEVTQLLTGLIDGLTRAAQTAHAKACAPPQSNERSVTTSQTDHGRPLGATR